jgi:ATP-dependent DNA ligase
VSDPLALLGKAERAVLREQAQPDWAAPMLATLTDRRFSDPDWLFERKLDGERALVFRQGGTVRLLSRNRKDIGGTIPSSWRRWPPSPAPTSWPTARS